MERDLEQAIDQALRAMPDPAAPPTLLPRVMASVVAELERPWYARAWVTWPREFQIASGLVSLLVGIGVWTLAVVGPAWLVALAGPTTDWGLARLSSVGAGLGQVAVVSRVLWDVLLQPVVFHFAALVVVGALACAALWRAITSLALGGAVYR